MNIQRTFALKRGFTLIELMVAMAITSIIITVLVSITSIALDTWNRSRSELRASRQAKAMIDTMSRDFESLVVRKGGTSEWLSAVVSSTLPGGKLKSTNACTLIFFTASTDRYDGKIGDPIADKGGDVSCVAYNLDYNDPVVDKGPFPTFILKRLLLNPDVTFGTSPTTGYLGKDDLAAAFVGTASFLKPENFVCENIYQFTVTFHLQVSKVAGGTTTTTDVPVIVGSGTGRSTSDFKIQGTGNVISSPITGYSAAELKAGRLTAVEISTTVLSDFGLEQSKNRSFADNNAKAKFLATNSYQYSKLVNLPSM